MDGDKTIRDSDPSWLGLRDYFAGQTLAGYGHHDAEPHGRKLEYVAKTCYRMADAMLAERNKKKKEE